MYLTVEGYTPIGTHADANMHTHTQTHTHLNTEGNMFLVKRRKAE